jgi:hypothetical protein
MWDPITLLETIGADANLANASAVQLGESLEGAGLEPALRSALLQGDPATLGKLLRAPDIVCCLIDPSKEDEEEEEEEDDVEEEDEDEDDEDKPAPAPKPKPRGASV